MVACQDQAILAPWKVSYNAQIIETGHNEVGQINGEENWESSS